MSCKLYFCHLCIKQLVFSPALGATSSAGTAHLYGQRRIVPQSTSSKNATIKSTYGWTAHLHRYYLLYLNHSSMLCKNKIKRCRIRFFFRAIKTYFKSKFVSFAFEIFLLLLPNFHNVNQEIAVSFTETDPLEKNFVYFLPLQQPNVKKV